MRKHLRYPHGSTISKTEKGERRREPFTPTRDFFQVCRAGEEQIPTCSIFAIRIFQAPEPFSVPRLTHFRSARGDELLPLAHADGSPLQENKVALAPEGDVGRHAFKLLAI